MGVLVFELKEVEEIGREQSFRRKTSRKICMITAHCLVVGFFAGLGRQSKGNSIAFRIAQDNLALDDGVGAVNQTGNVEASLGDDIFTDNLIKFDFLDDASFDGFGIGQVNSDGKGFGDKGDFVGLGLVFLTAVLVFSSSIVITITGWFAAGDLHGLGFLSISHLSDASIQSGDFVLVAVGTEFVRCNLGVQSTDGFDLFVTVVIVFNNLDVKGDGLFNIGESGHANLSVDRGVGIPAVVLGTIGGSMVTIGGSMVGKSHQR